MNESPESGSSWWVYLIRTRHQALYCGITNNLERRLKMHREGKGAKYLRGKSPLALVWSQELENKALALKMEYKIKQYSKDKKERLVADNSRIDLAQITKYHLD